METDRIKREIAREQTRQEAEEIRRRTDEQRYQQTLLDRKKDDKRNHAKLLEVKAHNTKLITEGITQQQRTQERHDLEMQLVRKRYIYKLYFIKGDCRSADEVSNTARPSTC